MGLIFSMGPAPHRLIFVPPGEQSLGQPDVTRA